jgi:hypothetical protein
VFQFCYVCSDTGKIVCETCRGKGLVGGFLGIGARACPICSGAGDAPCPDCDAELGNLMRPMTGPSLTQSVLATIESLEDSREIVLPPEGFEPLEDSEQFMVPIGAYWDPSQHHE